MSSEWLSASRRNPCPDVAGTGVRITPECCPDAPEYAQIIHVGEIRRVSQSILLIDESEDANECLNVFGISISASFCGSVL